jgi:hypothetical protein
VSQIRNPKEDESSVGANDYDWNGEGNERGVRTSVCASAYSAWPRTTPSASKAMAPRMAPPPEATRASTTDEVRTSHHHDLFLEGETVRFFTKLTVTDTDKKKSSTMMAILSGTRTSPSEHRLRREQARWNRHDVLYVDMESKGEGGGWVDKNKEICLRWVSNP